MEPDELFDIIGDLGRGTWGRVEAARIKKQRDKYGVVAVKFIELNHINKNKGITCVENEINIMKKVAMENMFPNKKFLSCFQY